MNPSGRSSDLSDQHTGSGQGRVRIKFRLVQDELGYPPATSEMLWAAPVGESLFCLDNIPFFVRGLSCFDVVQAREGADGLLEYDHLVEPRGHSTIRVIFHDTASDPRPLADRVAELRRQLRELACPSELSHIPRLIAIDIPPEADFTLARAILDAGERRKLWEYEEATIGRPIS
jgi:hypothetical protein